MKINEKLLKPITQTRLDRALDNLKVLAKIEGLKMALDIVKSEDSAEKAIEKEISKLKDNLDAEM